MASIAELVATTNIVPADKEAAVHVSELNNDPSKQAREQLMADFREAAQRRQQLDNQLLENRRAISDLEKQVEVLDRRDAEITESNGNIADNIASFFLPSNNKIEMQAEMAASKEGLVRERQSRVRMCQEIEREIGDIQKKMQKITEQTSELNRSA